MEKKEDIYAKLLRDRIVPLLTVIDDASANDVIAKMLFLQMDNAQTPVTLLINSPGGSVTAGLAILDTMQFISCPVHTFTANMAAGMALLLLAGGEPGQRRVGRDSHLAMCRSIAAQDMDAKALEFLERLNQRISRNFNEFTQLSIERILEDMKHERTYTPEGARFYGFIDEVLA